MVVNNIELYGRILYDQTQPMKKRFRALFALKHFGGIKSIEAIAKCFSDPSALLKHELAYCLGQMRDTLAIPTLVGILEDDRQEPVVRHEAGEALAAIGDQNSVEILEKFINHPVQEIAETCQLALERLRWLAKKDSSYIESEKCSFTTVDPTPANCDTQEVAALKKILIDPSKSLWDRYRAMFKLRNLATEDSILALAEGLKCDDSALFRHEVAFVLGQLQSPLAVRQLIDRLKDPRENCMVRHECAETLGSIGTENCKIVLKKFQNDPERIVRESCDVALDICEYNENDHDFQYAECKADSKDGASASLTDQYYAATMLN